MKRILSFMMTLVIMCGLLISPLGSIRVSANSWEGFVFSDKSVKFDGEDSNDTGEHFRYKVEAPIGIGDPSDTVKSSLESFINLFKGCISAESDGSSDKVTLYFEEDSSTLVTELINNSSAFKEVADNKLIRTQTDVVYDKRSDNEIIALVCFNSISKDFKIYTTYVVIGCTTHGTKDKGTGYMFAKSGSSRNIEDYNDVGSLPDCSELSQAAESLAGYMSESEFTTIKANAKTIFNLIYNNPDYMSQFGNLDINSPENLTDMMNILFTIQGSTTQVGRDVKMTVTPNDNYLSGVASEISVKLAESPTDELGPASETEAKCNTIDSSDIVELGNIYNSYIGSSTNKEELLNKVNTVSTKEVIWDFIRIVSNTKIDTEIQSNVDPNASDAELDILNVFNVYQYILKASLEFGKTTDIGAYVHSVTLTGKNSSDSYDVVLSAGSTGTKIESITRVDGTKIDTSMLTEYQYDSLMTTYTKLCNRIPNKQAYIEEFYNQDIKCTSDLSQVVVDEDMIKDCIEEFETYSYLQSPQGVIDIARLSNTLMEYTLYHATTTNYDVLSEEHTNYNKVLHNLLNNWGAFGTEPDIQESRKEKDFSEDGKTLLFCDMPSKVGILEGGYKNLADDAVNGNKGFDSIMAILQAQSYVFEALKESVYGESNGYTPENLAAILENPFQATDAEYEGLGDVINFLQQCHNGSAWDASLAADAYLKQTTNIWIFRCIIELYDTCQLLQIDPSKGDWSTTIREYYELYTNYPDAFEAMRSSELLYGRGYTGGATIDNPLGVFYSVQGKEMSDKWNIGFANSALYVPMVTNLYDAGIYEFANTKDKDWIAEFMYKYGFHRKALYISTDPNIVVNNKLNKTSDNGMVVATLKDLLNYERDIQLYIDTSFYNAQHIENAIGKVDYATLYQYMHDKDITLNVTDQAALENAQEQANNAEMTFYNEDSNNFIDETLNIDTKTLLKDDDIVSYSPDVAKNVTHLGETADDTDSLYDGYVLSADALTGQDSVFTLYNYTPITSYAVVSAIYRDVDIYNELASASKQTRIVFESSKNILYAEGTTNKNWISYLNYIQLSNLQNQMNMNVETQLDLESPIFIDIFGNIVTESGFVIIPAASNATLCGDAWTPYTIAFGTYMSAGGNEVLAEDLPKDVFEWLTAQNIEEFYGDEAEEEEEETVESLSLDSMGAGTKGGWFVYTRDGKLQLKNVYLDSWGLSALVNWSTLNANSNVIQEVFWNNAFFNKAIKMYNSRTINMVTEVLRGAPIENIDYVEEGISGTRSGEAGIVIAYALDELLNTLSSEDSDFVNSMTTMPNPAFSQYLKYVIYFGIKIILALSILVFLIYLFKSGVKNRLGFKEVLKLAITVVVVISAIYILPNSITWSYDSANANLLSEEAEEILLYSSMREAEGQQIGITEVSKIDEQTQLLVQVDKVTPSWSKILGNALLSNEYESFVDLFDDALSETPYYGMAGVVQKGSNVYIDVQSIMDSTSIAYNKTTNTLYNKNVIRDEQQFYSAQSGTDTTESHSGSNVVVKPAGVNEDGFVRQDYYAVYSFTSPYYVILDSLIANINEYNQTHNIQTYTATIDSKGNVMTYDVATPYLTSDEFLTEGYDILGLTDALMLESTLPKFAYIFDEEDKAKIKESAWYPAELDEETIQVRIGDLYNYARSFIIDHKEVLRHVPDEMLVKVLAFACSIEYNKLFKCPYGDSIALITVDNRDIMRFMLSDFKGVYSNVSYSFGRYVYQTSGTVGVILAAILLVVILITTVIKPALIWILFIIIIINVIFRHMLFNKPNQGVEGYFTGCALFIAVNYLYAALLKVCFVVADSNLSAVTAMLMCILVQVSYLLVLGWLLYVQVKDWRDGGWNKFGPSIVAVGDYGRRMINRGYGYGRSRRNYNYRDPYYDDRYYRRHSRHELDGLIHGPNDEPQAVYMDERGRRGRRNRTYYNGPLSLEEMRRRDEERESSPYRR